MTEPQDPGASEPGRQCPWCAAPADDEATRCSACGAALAQRESIAGVLIPGLTGLDPALEDFDKRPLHISGPSPSQGMAPALMVAAAAGGPVGLMAVGGVAAVMAAEYIGATRGGPGGGGLESVGRPSEVVLQALERLEDATSEESASDGLPAAEDGRSIWRDLPPVDPSLVAAPDADPATEP